MVFCINTFQSDITAITRNYTCNWLPVYPENHMTTKMSKWLEKLLYEKRWEVYGLFGMTKWKLKEDMIAGYRVVSK